MEGAEKEVQSLLSGELGVKCESLDVRILRIYQ